MNLEKQLKEMLGPFYEKKVFDPKVDKVKTDQHVLHEAFSIETHKEHFINYLEIVVLSSGEILYAVPSHRYLCEAIIMYQNKWSVSEMRKSCPRGYWGDYNTWLTEESGALMVWDERYEGEPNEAQKQVLIQLTEAGLYKGKI